MAKSELRSEDSGRKGPKIGVKVRGVVVVVVVVVIDGAVEKSSEGNNGESSSSSEGMLDAVVVVGKLSAVLRLN